MKKLKHCVDCKQPFYGGHNSKRCPECQAKRTKEINKINYLKRRNKYNKSLKDINEIVREVEAYNKEHNTLITYGKYVAMMEGEKTK